MQVKDAAPRYQPGADAQQVPPGYKLTEVGVIPADWSSCSLFWLAGESKSRFDDGDWVEAEFLTDSGVRLLQTGNVGVGEFIDKGARKYIADESFDLLRCKEVCPGDLLICRLAEPAGRACIVPDLAERRMITAVDVTIFRPVPGLADSAFLLHVFGTQRWFKDVSDRCGGSTRSRIARGQLAKIKVQTPPAPEQRAIAEALSDVDNVLGALEALIAKKRAIKQAAMQQLLTGKTRLPGFSGAWETKRLGELGHFLKGSGVKRDDSQSGSLACVRYGEIYTTHHDYIREFHSWISRDVAAMATRLECGDLLFAGSGETKEEIGKCVAFLTPTEAYAGGDIVILRPPRLNSLFLGYALNMPDAAQQKASFGQGDAVVHISAAALGQVRLKLPNVDEQSAIAGVLSDIDAEIGALEARRDKTRLVKQGMMQQLLTGRVRLVDPEAPHC